MIPLRSSSHKALLGEYDNSSRRYDDDELYTKPPIRALRQRLVRDASRFVGQQRINCLLEGSWFKNAKESRNRVGAYKFLRLSPNRRHLHYVDASERYEVSEGLDSLPEHIDLSTITTIQSKLGGSSTTSLTSTINVLTLLSKQGVIAELIPLSPSQYSEWYDGLRYVLDESSSMTGQSNELVNTLTDLGVKIKLLDLAGENVDIPNNIPTPTPPRDTQFYFADN
ncbi:hypothetical protein E3P99_00065 [Wallemia hederae]|uniref:PH domain-containing protein n=1 Tax=Wallemia hederae TaxID=1540922 RepID=A0A4T0FXE4_9BASI|nr:hypothetical protein E3P99_00065 [Wallemia hederae]